mmetsp:Transcript_3557/g.4469  ORF Transcript_3557/g.4469 Transcript_3557/m.4469 type:complete len:207 (+) Transcript_3557:354-974(+)
MLYLLQALRNLVLDQAREIRRLSCKESKKKTDMESECTNEDVTKQLELDLEKSKNEKCQLEKELTEERSQLIEALRRLKVADEQINHLENLLHDYKHGFLNSERELLLQEVDSAASQLHLVVKEKYNAAEELEQVYDTLAKLETQLEATKRENVRLKDQIAFKSYETTFDHDNTGSDEADYVQSKPKQVVKNSIHIRRDGTVVIGS